MEASQASEAGSIPVARSATARLRAGRFCHASPTGTPGQPRTLLPSTRAPHAALRARTRYKTPPARGPRGSNRYKTLPAHSPAGDTGTKLSLHPQNGPFQHVLRQQGELYTAPTTNRSSREKKVPHQHPTSPTNAPLPQFRMQFYCMNFQQSPETLQSQRHEFKI